MSASEGGSSVSSSFAAVATALESASTGADAAEAHADAAEAHTDAAIGRVDALLASMSSSSAPATPTSAVGGGAPVTPDPAAADFNDEAVMTVAMTTSDEQRLVRSATKRLHHDYPELKMETMAGGEVAEALMMSENPQIARNQKRYVAIDGPGSSLGFRLSRDEYQISWLKSSFDKFKDGSDNIFVSGLEPDANFVADQHILFCASFHSNDAVLQCLRVLVMLLESDIASMTLVVPFFPCASMERVTIEGQVATANTTARLLSNLPSCGKPMRVITFDLHTEGNRFYFGHNAVADLVSFVPRMLRDKSLNIDVVVFPDEGARKRFGQYTTGPEWAGCVGHCFKVRNGEERTIMVSGDVDVRGQNVLIVDDFTRTGGTLCKCAEKLRAMGALNVHGYVTHCAGSVDELLAIHTNGNLNSFHTTNTVEHVTDQLPNNHFFHVHDIANYVLFRLYRVS